MFNYKTWFKLSGTLGACSVTSLALAPLAPPTWTFGAYVIAALIALATIAAGAMLFAGWRPSLPKLPQPSVPVGYGSTTRRYSSEQLRQVDADDDDNGAALCDWLGSRYR